MLRKAADRHWELASLSVPEGTEKKSVSISLSPDALVRDMSLHPDGDRLVVSTGILKRDIWILEGL